MSDPLATETSKQKIDYCSKTSLLIYLTINILVSVSQIITSFFGLANKILMNLIFIFDIIYIYIHYLKWKVFNIDILTKEQIKNQKLILVLIITLFTIIFISTIISLQGFFTILIPVYISIISIKAISLILQYCRAFQLI